MKAVYKKIREMMIYKGVRGRAAHIFGVIMLVFLGLVFAMPLYWMISTALKYETYCFTTPPQWFPNPIKWSNFTEIFGRMDMARYIKNTLITSILPGDRDIDFLSDGCLFDYKDPVERREVSVSDHFDDDDDPIDGNAGFQVMRHGQSWELNTFIPLVLPSFFGSTYYIYLFRQFMKSLPTSVIEAARIDGAGDFRILYSIVYPMCSSILTTVAVMVFIACWNDYVGPLMYLQDSKLYTLGIGLQMFKNAAQPEWTLLMAASTVFTVPLIVIFFFCQNAFLNGIQTTSGIK